MYIDNISRILASPRLTWNFLTVHLFISGFQSPRNLKLDRFHPTISDVLSLEVTLPHLVGAISTTYKNLAMD